MKELLRRVLHAGLTLALRLRSRRYSPAPAGRCVVLAPHQDDEAFGCAALILAHCTAGLSVNIVYLTDGAASHPGHPRLSPADIARLRHAEATRAMQGLGLPAASLHFLNAPDGTLARLPATAAEDLAQRLASTLRTLQPTEIALPCRDDGSSEHTAAFALAQRAQQLAGLHPRLLEYPVWARWSPLRLVQPGIRSRRVWRLAFPNTVALKRAALAAYASQAEPTPPWPRPVLPPGFVRFFTSAEEFYFER
jgi:LmbE family N-acetylglucosaminyl deacetylase